MWITIGSHDKVVVIAITVLVSIVIAHWKFLSWTVFTRFTCLSCPSFLRKRKHFLTFTQPVKVPKVFILLIIFMDSLIYFSYTKGRIFFSNARCSSVVCDSYLSKDASGDHFTLSIINYPFVDISSWDVSDLSLQKKRKKKKKQVKKAPSLFTLGSTRQTRFFFFCLRAECKQNRPL